MSSATQGAAPPTAGSKSAACGPLAKSRVSRVRGLVLVLVHVAVFLHLAHWKIAGTTLTPVEPSEAMQTLELGYVNAGFVLLVIALAATFVFGRFFCGWACHVVALQDACGALMSRFGVRPRPFRSRLLAYVPLGAGLYMFVWPTLKRFVNFAAWTPESFVRLMDWPSADRWFEVYRKPDFRAHFFTDDVWRTFPGPLMAVVTLLVCGPLIVWFLGNKGFCTYGCPYGGLFGVADRLSPVRIRATDACEGCGHCTAVCTSNVRVHEEVKLYRAVVDAQCMKCLDCVSVCPKDALYVGFGAPAVVAKPRAPRPRRAYDFGWPAELALAAVFAAALFAYRSLYDQVPFLLALGLASLTAFVVRVLWNAAAGKSAAIQNVKLFAARKPTRAGVVVGGALLVFVAFGGHSFFVQYHDTAGRYRLREHNALVDAGRGRTPEAQASLVAAAEHLDRAAETALLPMRTTGFAAGRSWFKLGEFARATRRLAPLVAAGPESPEDVLMLAMARGQSGDLAGGVADVETYLKLRPENQAARQMLAEMKRALGG
jgi:polyferredoxin